MWVSKARLCVSCVSPPWPWGWHLAQLCGLDPTGPCPVLPRPRLAPAAPSVPCPLPPLPAMCLPKGRPSAKPRPLEPSGKTRGCPGDVRGPHSPVPGARVSPRLGVGSGFVRGNTGPSGFSNKVCECRGLGLADLCSSPRTASPATAGGVGKPRQARGWAEGGCCLASTPRSHAEGRAAWPVIREVT